MITPGKTFLCHFVKMIMINLWSHITSSERFTSWHDLRPVHVTGQALTSAHVKPRTLWTLNNCYFVQLGKILFSFWHCTQRTVVKTKTNKSWLEFDICVCQCWKVKVHRFKTKMLNLKVFSKRPGNTDEIKVEVHTKRHEKLSCHKKKCDTCCH